MMGRLAIKDVRTTYSILKPYMITHRKAYMGLFLLLFVDIGLTLSFSWFFGHLTDAAIHSFFGRMKWLVPLGALLVAVSIASTYLTTLWETIATNGVKRDFSADVFKHIMQLPGKHIDGKHSGDLLAHFTNDIHNLDGIIGSSLIYLIKLPFIYVAVFIYLLQISWKLALVSVFVAPVAMVSGVIFGFMLRKNNRQIQDLVARMNVLLNETFSGLFVIRSFLMEKFIFAKYVNRNQELYALELQNAKLRGWFYVGSQAAASVTFLISLCLGSYYVSSGVLTVGALLTFINLVNHLVYPLTELAGQWAGLQKSISAMERIFKILEIEIESDSLPEAIAYKPMLSAIHFKDVSFSYDGQKLVFDQFHLQIPPGKVVAIVGLSGAGKSTLFHLLQGFYLPQSGSITINGHSTAAMTVSEQRSLFAHVSQETVLFSGTVRENLQLAKPGITDAQMIQAASIAGIHTFITTLPNGYDTEIGERGSRLSGGQRQRMAIARALLKDAPILLLDEGTSALDSETEYHVQKSMEKLLYNRTTLVIAHRLSTVQNADLILVMDEGKIVQMGRHEEIIRQEGLYRRLYRLQAEKGAPPSDDHSFDTRVV
ncbi:ABC transporter ATP-binding protein [Paenibacillus chondroitinus]|uniref:ABC transporter ATP-binding protein n=1 Tax=Paenibacillus chondroitinus TaxID=59842 RepID=A0ABU6DIU6_9BACL|nr:MULTISPECIES: ABC transporter ATP-binding protein [Paenibacillus]MCY9660237.1 ABC transporter ATP-binding protein/permease [Paenibacillus anseongense]MEB4797663.1 ABC transporter ATP-binding protein [Paenibacillus chondroitinus]